MGYLNRKMQELNLREEEKEENLLERLHELLEIKENENGIVYIREEEKEEENAIEKKIREWQDKRQYS